MISKSLYLARPGRTAGGTISPPRAGISCTRKRKDGRKMVEGGKVPRFRGTELRWWPGWVPISRLDPCACCSFSISTKSSHDSTPPQRRSSRRCTRSPAAPPADSCGPEGYAWMSRIPMNRAQTGLTTDQHQIWALRRAHRTACGGVYIESFMARCAEKYVETCQNDVEAAVPWP